MSRRSGFTLIEVIIAIAIVGVFCALLIPAIQEARNMATAKAGSGVTTYVAEVVRKYEVVANDGRQSYTIFRVDVRQQNSENIDPLRNVNSDQFSKQNSDQLHANLEEHNWYQFSVTQPMMGSNQLPNVLSAVKVTNPIEPKIVNGEIQY
jgi:prepilin-type N-terminal cleavage/methylation domain-containing protein